MGKNYKNYMLNDTTIIEQMSSTKDTKPKKPISEFSGKTPAQIRKKYQSLVDPKTFEKYRKFCADDLKSIQKYTADYTTLTDIELRRYIRIYSGSPALTGYPYFDGDIQILFDSQRTQFIAQITRERFLQIFSSMVEACSLQTPYEWEMTDRKRTFAAVFKSVIQEERFFIVDHTELSSLLPDELKPLFEKKQPSAGAVSAPVKKSAFIGFKPVVGNFAGKSPEERVCGELATLSKNEITLVRLFMGHNLKSSKAMVRDSSRAAAAEAKAVADAKAAADAKAGDGDGDKSDDTSDDESDDKSDDESDDESESEPGMEKKKCDLYSIERDAKNVEEIIYGKSPYVKEFHWKFQHCRDANQCPDCGALCGALTVSHKIQLCEPCEDEKSIDRFLRFYKSPFMKMVLSYYLRTIIGAESVLAQKLESGELCDLIQISKSLESLGFPSETEEEMKEREMKQRQRQALDMEAFLKHSDIETHGMGAYHSVRDCGCDSRFRCPHMMYE